MRILAITPYYKPEGGGLERYAHEILQRLEREGDQIRALTFTREGHKSHSLDGVDIHRRNPLFSLGNAPISPRFPSITQRHINAFNPDVIVAHTPVPFPAEAGFHASRDAGIPFVVTYHAGRLHGSSSTLDWLASLYRASVERWMLEESDHLIAVGPFVRDNALSRYRDRVTLIPPGVDMSTFHPNGVTPDDDILFVGPLSSSYAWKGLDTLWEAFQQVHQHRPSASLTLVGQGDRYQEFQERARRQELPVRLLGRIPQQELVEAYRRARVVVLPSTSDAESFGMVLAEANACSRPVIASRVGGIPDFVRDGDNGRLVPPGEADPLADRITELLENPKEARAMGERGRQRVSTRHDWDLLAHRTREVLAGVVNG